MMNPEIKVLDKGFVRLIDHMGSDLSVVNAARVSFGRTKDAFEDGDAKLLVYLAEHEHTSPFRHTALTLHVKAPIFVFRQWMKHLSHPPSTEGLPIARLWFLRAGEMLPAPRLANGAMPRENPAVPALSDGQRHELGTAELNRVYCVCSLVFRISLMIVTNSSGLTGFSRYRSASGAAAWKASAT